MQYSYKCCVSLDAGVILSKRFQINSQLALLHVRLIFRGLVQVFIRLCISKWVHSKVLTDCARHAKMFMGKLL